MQPKLRSKWIIPSTAYLSLICFCIWSNWDYNGV